MKKRCFNVLIVLFSLIIAPECFADVRTDIDNKAIITAVMNPEWEPYILFDNGNAVGIVPDIVSIIEKDLGVDIEIIGADSSEQYIDYVNSGNYDLVLDVIYEKGKDYYKDYYLSEPYLYVGYSRVALREPKSSNVKVAVADRYSLRAMYAKQYYSADQIKYFDSVSECLEAVKSGDCTELVVNSFEAGRIVNNDIKDRYVETILNGRTLDICIGVNKRLGKDFAGDFKEAVNGLDLNEITNIISKSAYYNEPKMSMTDRLYCNPIMGFMVIGSFSLIVVMVLSFTFFIRKQKYNASRSQLLQSALANAENANNAKGQFLARMSHEIRTPMNAIAGFVALAKDRSYNSEAVMEYLDKIESASSILLRLINDVLDMSAIESNKFSIYNNKFNFLEFMEQISSMYYAQCSAKKVHFEMTMIDITEEILIGDSLRLNQILFNLLSNSVKFTDEGGSVSLNVIQTSKTDDKVYIKFIISDTGCGMSSDMLSRVFKPFEQESSYNTRKYGGSGLGLSIVKSLVDMMQGAITVESAKDEGTTFVVDMPFGITGETYDEQSKKISSVRALLINDNGKNCRHTEEIFEKIGIEFDTVECSGKVINELIDGNASGKDYDICFVDCDKTDTFSANLTAKIRKLLGDDIVIVIISPEYASDAQERAKAAGANMFVMKPIYQPVLFNILMTVSSKKKHKQPMKKYDFSGYKVLMAEDNQLNRDIATALLENVNLKVDCAADGLEAVDMFLNSQKGEYKAVLMDIQMPVMDGYEAARIIRTSQHFDAKSIPIYAMTANAFTEDVSAALSSGMNGHIPKPIDTRTLYEAIKECISRSG